MMESPKARPAVFLNELERTKQALTNSHTAQSHHCNPTPAELLMMLSVLR